LTDNWIGFYSKLWSWPPGGGGLLLQEAMPALEITMGIVLGIPSESLGIVHSFSVDVVEVGCSLYRVAYPAYLLDTLVPQ
jgi:hypothetical protein